MDGSNLITSEYGTINEVIEKLKISRSTIYSLEAKTLIRFRRLGGKIYIKWAEIKKAIDDSCPNC